MCREALLLSEFFRVYSRLFHNRQECAGWQCFVSAVQWYRYDLSGLRVSKNDMASSLSSYLKIVCLQNLDDLTGGKRFHGLSQSNFYVSDDGTLYVFRDRNMFCFKLLNPET